MALPAGTAEASLPKPKDELHVTGTVSAEGAGWKLAVEEVRRGADVLYRAAK